MQDDRQQNTSRDLTGAESHMTSTAVVDGHHSFLEINNTCNLDLYVLCVLKLLLWSNM